jgi:hypothetical protein
VGTLPTIPLPTREIVVGGGTVKITSLTRADALYVKSHFDDGTADAAEAFIVAKGVGVTEEEAAAWIASTPVKDAGLVIDGIIYLSGLAEPGDGRADPK